MRLNKYLQLELGVHAGNDVAPWSNSAHLNGLAMVRWVARNNNNSIYGGINSLGSGEYSHEHDNLQMVVVTWGHRFSEAVHMMSELYYMWQKDAAVGGTAIDGPAKSYYMGTGAGAIVPGLSTALGFVNYFQVKLAGTRNYISLRNDFLNDPQGNRTGFTTAYSSHTIGWVHRFNSLVCIRPELRYERAYAKVATPYDNGLRRDQCTAATDLIVRF